jgi:hypothetical protein
MRISKLLLAVGIVAIGMMCFARPSPDNDAQSAARAALRKKLAEEQGAPVQAAPVAPVAPVAPAPAPAPVLQPIVVPPPPAPAPVTTVVQPVRAEPEAIAKAREAMRAKMQELEQQTPSAPAETSTTVITPAPAAPVAPAVAAAPEAPVAPAGPSPAMAPPAAPATKKGVPAFEPLPGPESPISPEKQQQLAELLRKYRSEELSPEEYHKERARILGGQ